MVDSKNSFSLEKYISDPDAYSSFPKYQDMLSQLTEGCKKLFQNVEGAPYRIHHTYFDTNNSLWYTLIVEIAGSGSQKLIGCLVSSVPLSQNYCSTSNEIPRPKWYRITIGDPMSRVENILGSAKGINNTTLGLQENINENWYFPDPEDPSIMLTIYSLNSRVVAMSFEYVW